MNYKDFITIGLMPEIDSTKGNDSTEMRIATSLLAFAAGDAIGVEYEIQEVKKPVQINRMGTRDDWPFGGVSDDTLLSLITIQTFAETTIDHAKVRFLENLKAAVPNLRDSALQLDLLSEFQCHQSLRPWLEILMVD